MTTPHHFPSDSDSLEGRVFRPASHAELVEAVEQAFDYRGDVSLQLTSGQTVEGYVSNRDTHAAQPFLQIFPKVESGLRLIRYADVKAISFTGKDTASGKSWEAWVTKKEAQRRAEAEEASNAAKARGHL
jgi:lipopolysaccharide export system protein LptC